MNYAYAHWPKSIGSEGRYNQNLRATSCTTAGRYVRSRTDFISRFYSLLRQWNSETAFSSDPDEITANRSYQELIALGANITPLVVDELRRGPSVLVWLLDDMYNIQPYSSDETGNISAMSNAWIAWAVRNGQSL